MSLRPHRPRKRFGQHFLHDPHVIRRIIEALDPRPGYRIIEIGPGRGALTGPLLETPGLENLEVIEIDRDLAGELEQRYLAAGRLTVHCMDVLRFDFRAGDNRPIRLLGNLPYNISTPLLFHLLDYLDCIDVMVVMLQKEVAERICAEPGKRDYGRLSVNVQAVCNVESLFDVGKGAFSPPPRVDSAVIRLRPAESATQRIHDRKLFQQLVRTCFSHRRKTLRNSLKGLLNSSAIEAEGIGPDQRPEELSVDAFTRLANRLHEQTRKATAR